MQLVYNSSKEDLDRLKQVNVKIQRYPYIPYSFDLYLFAMQGFLPLLMLMSFIYPVINITKSIVLEKEKRLKVRFSKYFIRYLRKFEIKNEISGIHENDGLTQLAALAGLVYKVILFPDDIVFNYHDFT